MNTKFRFGLVVCLTAIILVFLIPLQLIALLLAKLGWTGPAGLIPVFFHRLLLKMFGIRLIRKGKLSRDRPLLLVSNHVSWLDIIVMGAVEPLSFVAKSEMRGWPLFGSLACLQRTVFIQREARRQSGHQANEIADRMTSREIMVLFPEGTTTDGNQLAPFKTTLFEAAKIALARSPVETAAVQPVAIAYTHIHGLPIGRSDRPHVAWPGEIGLGESLFPLVGEGALDVTVLVGDPITLTEASNRKVIAKNAADALRSMLDSSLRSG